MDAMVEYAPESDPVETIVRFGRALRTEGVPAGPDRVAELCRAAALLPAEDLYWAGRATLVSKPEHIPTYDAVFGRFFGPPTPSQGPPVQIRVQMEAETDVGLASAVELLKDKSFSRCSKEELSQLAELMSRIALSVPRRRTRRRETSRAGLPDLRRTLRRSFRTGGDPLERAWRRRRRRPRRLILLLDVSGSMDAYSRALVMFAHAALRSDPRWEAFCFGTRLTRVTRALAGSDPTRRSCGRRRRSSTGTAARASATPSSASSTSTVTAGWPAARSSSSAPTASRSATPTCSPSRWPASRGSPTASSG
jgi:hypothetical protein